MHWNLFAPRYALTLLLIIGSLPFSLHAQHQKNCAHLEAEAWMQDAYPKWPTRQEFEAHLSRAQSQTVLRDDTIYTIPVIIHVVHDGEPVGFGYNISQEQILSQIEVLNEDYRRKPGTPGFNSNPVGADIQIEFCLAAVDPEGNLLEELGIHRINRNDENWIDPPFSVGFVKQAMMPLHFWDPERYMNVWSVPLANDFLGFAQLPNFSTLPDLNPNHGPAVTDGVVITPTAFGRVGSVEEPYNQGRTMTHEVGHWLGLLHIWGDGPCGTDDNCPDTPEAIDPHYDCPDERTEACGDANFYENYMDYTDDVCMNLFTSCQRSRMRTVIQVGERRVSLLNSDVCQADLPPIADFSANRRFVCEQSTVRFSSQSRSNPTAWEWEFPGGNPSSSSNENPAVSYETSGTYDVRLIVSNAFGADTLAQTAFIKVDSVGSEIILSQTFETGLGDWTVDNPDGQITWELAQVAGTDSGEIAIGINLYEYTNARARDGLISPLLDLSGYEGAVLTFQHAYRQGTLADRDSLLVQVSQNGGDSYANTVLNVAEDGSRNFATNVNLNESMSQSGSGIGALAAMIGRIAFEST
ncbi:MAG: M43 family zinc metalloprotease [Bacteroidota bacterium]